MAEEMLSQTLAEKESLRAKTSAALTHFKAKMNKTEAVLEAAKERLAKLSTYSNVLDGQDVGGRDRHPRVDSSFQENVSEWWEAHVTNVSEAMMNMSMASISSPDIHSPPSMGGFNADTILAQRDAALKRVVELEKFIVDNHLHSDGTKGAEYPKYFSLYGLDIIVVVVVVVNIFICSCQERTQS